MNNVLTAEAGGYVLVLLAAAESWCGDCGDGFSSAGYWDVERSRSLPEDEPSPGRSFSNSD